MTTSRRFLPSHRRVVLLVPPGGQLVGSIGFIEAMDAANRFRIHAGREPLYEITVVGVEASTTTATGLVLATPRADPGMSVHTFVVAGSLEDAHRPISPPVIELAQALAGGAERIVSVCMGAFVLGTLGLLRGRRCTTHWLALKALRERFPDAVVEGDAIYTEDRGVFTSAGATAGIDLALHLIALDGGSRLAVDVARSLVVFARRPGGQSQFGSAVQTRHDLDQRLATLIDEVRERPGDEHRVGALAAKVGMSPRNFARVFKKQVGLTPAAFVAQIRVEAAQRALQIGDASIEQIAQDLGFGTVATFRRSFARVTGVTPSEWRARFSNPR